MLRSDVDDIKRAVQHTRGEYDTRLHGKTRPFWRLPVVERQDLLRSVSAELHAQLDMIQPRILSRSDVMRVAASYAYWWDMETYNEAHPAYPNKGTAYVVFCIKMSWTSVVSLSFTHLRSRPM